MQQTHQTHQPQQVRKVHTIEKGEAATVASMSEAAKEKRREYMREWRKRNPDKTREYDRRRWEKAAEQEQGEQWQQLQSEKTSA